MFTIKAWWMGKNVIVTPGRNGNQAPYLPYSWTKLYSVSGWTDDGDSEFDYGAIKLNGSPGDYTGWLGYRTTNVESPKGLLAVVPGYPCDKVGNEKYTMWTDYGPIEGTSPRMLTYRMDTYGCQSGAPVYHDYSRTGVTIIATHTVGSNSWNSGNRVTDDVFNNLKNGLNKYNKFLWILCCVLVIIIVSSSIANKEKKFSKVVNSITFHVKNKEKQPIKDFEIILMKDESPQPSREIGISIGKTDEEGKVIWRNVRTGKYIVFLPNNKAQMVMINDRDETKEINISL